MSGINKKLDLSQASINFVECKPPHQSKVLYKKEKNIIVIGVGVKDLLI